MIYQSHNDSTMRMVPVSIDIPAKPRTLESLIEKYSMMHICPATAQVAMAERDVIVFECDTKGYHTVEDMQMIEYLWEIRNAVVHHILTAEKKSEALREVEQREEIRYNRMSAQEKDEAYEMYCRSR